VFSSWVRMLYLIEVALGKVGISCVRLVGTMQADDREKILENFRNNPSTNVLLISIGAGSVG
jgi:SNF2 family DNA or RNA helicase